MLIFPGQGSQYKGMGTDLIEKSKPLLEIYNRASSVLGYDIAELSFEDKNDEINLTKYTQPVLMTHQIACYEYFSRLHESAIKPTLLAGHSLGEYTALVISGSITFEEGLSLVCKRGELMGTHGSGSMLAMPFERDAAEDIIHQSNCEIATVNQLKQTVIGGADIDIDRLREKLANDFPKKRTVKLKTEGAFHTSLMKRAAKEFKGYLNKVSFKEMSTPVLSNFSSEIHKLDGSETAELLYNQLFKPVNWLGCMRTASKMEVDSIIEFGGGIGDGMTPNEKRPNLEGITKKNFRESKNKVTYFPAINASTIESSAKILQS
ncbi:MAG: malonyl CoA-acyl carrier protein transacylase [Gammaproteobacteria bacterium]|jgi:[acyl-carrier-protein] S-malonyltransferase|nr:malonyl CoA-acyl carrier protein transacylase [Gammaproteobacteria bacterium]|tara:strand:+ start:25281 stop:26240 length:960 start_codon:yes stop_codon:yes gene_type:complete